MAVVRKLVILKVMIGLDEVVVMVNNKNVKEPVVEDISVHMVVT